MATRRAATASKGRPKVVPPEHSPLQVRWKRFRGFRDTDWLKLRRLTVLVGPNNCGKSSLIAPLLLLKQTLQSKAGDAALITDGDLVRCGPFSELVFEHQSELDVGFGIRFHHHEPDGKLPNVGNSPPGALEVEFRASALGSPVLSRFAVSDIFGRLFLERRLQAHRYSLAALPGQEGNREQMDLIEKVTPEGFLFTARAVLRGALELQGTDPDAQRLSQRKVAFAGQAQMYLAIVDYTQQKIRDQLGRLSYLGPLRARPERVYSSRSDPVDTVGVDGQDAPELLYRRQGELGGFVNRWIRRLEFGTTVECLKSGAGAFQVQVRRATGVPINIADTGFGFSQAFPLVVQAAAARPLDLLVVEQPEIHLNPRLQYELADLFVDVVAKECNVIVETHSEHFLLRLRRLLAERKIQASDVSLLYVEKQGKQSTVRTVPIHDDGSIPADEWPEGFFEDALKEALALASAQASSTDE